MFVCVVVVGEVGGGYFCVVEGGEGGGVKLMSVNSVF